MRTASARARRATAPAVRRRGGRGSRARRSTDGRVWECDPSGEARRGRSSGARRLPARIGRRRSGEPARVPHRGPAGRTLLPLLARRGTRHSTAGALEVARGRDGRTHDVASRPRSVGEDDPDAQAGRAARRASTAAKGRGTTTASCTSRRRATTACGRTTRATTRCRSSTTRRRCAMRRSRGVDNITGLGVRRPVRRRGRRQPRDRDDHAGRADRAGDAAHRCGARRLGDRRAGVRSVRNASVLQLAARRSTRHDVRDHRAVPQADGDVDASSAAHSGRSACRSRATTTVRRSRIAAGAAAAAAALAVVGGRRDQPTTSARSRSTRRLMSLRMPRTSFSD